MTPPRLPISFRTLQRANWQKVFTYNDGVTLSFVSFACPDIPGLLLTHEKRAKSSKSRSVYSVVTQTPTGDIVIRTDSRCDAVRKYNAETKKRERSGRHAAGSPESIKRQRRDGGSGL